MQAAGTSGRPGSAGFRRNSSSIRFLTQLPLLGHFHINFLSSPPFPPDTFDLALIVHFRMDALLPRIEPVIKKGG
jgi:hypothetical protein